jgi:hypothetical protein
MEPPMEELIPKALDITAPDHVEIEIDHVRNVVYVHINGITLLRACRVGTCDVRLHSASFIRVLTGEERGLYDV